MASTTDRDSQSRPTRLQYHRVWQVTKGAECKSLERSCRFVFLKEKAAEDLVQSLGTVFFRIRENVRALLKSCLARADDRQPLHFLDGGVLQAADSIS